MVLIGNKSDLEIERAVPVDMVEQVGMAVLSVCYVIIVSC